MPPKHCPKCGSSKIIRTKDGIHCRKCGFTNSKKKPLQLQIFNFNSKVILLLIFLLIMPLISASDLDCSLNPHFMKEGVPVNIYDNFSTYDGIFFDVICSNNLKDSRILSLSMINASPIELKNSLSGEIPFIRILEKDKVLFVSGILSTKDFPNNQYMNFSVEILGMIEKTSTPISAIASREIFINHNEFSNSIFIKIGKAIMPSSPIIGLGILGLAIIFIIYIFYMQDIGKKINEWKRRQQVKRLQKKEQEERFRQMR